jgi:uncharacterized protein (TIGR03083 family)
MLDHDRIIAAEAEALAEAGEATAHAASVPGTDWDLDALLDHVGRLTWFWSGRVRKAGGGDFYDTERPDDVSASDWIRQGTTTMREQLAAADPEAEVKTWAGLKPPSWLWRRMTHELAVHRWDAQRAGGEPQPIDEAVADDGIDELLQEFAPIADVSGVGGTIHLHATDGDGSGEWFIDTSDGLSWSRAHEKGDVAVRGTTSDLLLFLWGRVPVDHLEVHGDTTVLDRWRTATRF